MSVEAVILAIASAVRPSTALAAVFTLLANVRARPLLAAFIVCGFAFSALLGLIIVSALHGVPLPGRASTRTDVVDIVAGTAMLGFAAGTWSGRMQTRRRRRAAEERPSRIIAMLQRPSLKMAGGAGSATHLPGLFYLVALNSIAAPKPGLTSAALQVAVYNAIWFSVPIAGFVLARNHLAVAHNLMSRTNDWSHRHRQVIVSVLFAVVGAWLLIKGVIGLLT
jgi:Sap, sulfolipid-1-addressing protein